jgi:hypothetical protein
MGADLSQRKAPNGRRLTSVAAAEIAHPTEWNLRMTVFDVYVNDCKCCRAGVGADGVLTAIVNWVKLTGPAARTARRFRQPVEESRLHVGGLSKGSHRSWVEQDLKVGDRVAIVVGKASTVDRPLRQRSQMSRPAKREETTFLNVDLDIWSRSPLDSLVKALGPAVLALYVGREGRRHTAHLETASHSDDPDRLIRRFVAMVKRLPRAERRIWDRARLREFNVGIQAATAPASYELHLEPATVRDAASVNAGVGITVYGAAITARASRQRSRSRAVKL